MNKKILFVYSQEGQIELPQKLVSEYQIRSVLAISFREIYKTIVEYKPQLVFFDENVKIKYIKYISDKFKFIPICIFGYFDKPQVLEKFLQLNLTTINLTQSETEISSIIENLLWFSLSKEELWDEEYKLCRTDLLKSKFLFFSKIFGLSLLIVILFFFLPKLYNILAITKPIYNEVDLKYISPSDIVVLKDKIVITDWTIRNIFEYDLYNEQLVKMYIAEEQFNAVSMNNNNYFVSSSMFSNNVRISRYPEFSVTISTLTLFREKTVMALHLTDDNNLYVLNNKNTLFHYEIKDNKNIVLVSSFVITEFFPVDVYVYNNDIFFLDNKNNVYKIKNFGQKQHVYVLLEKFFDPQQIKFVSFAINEDWLYFVSERSKKIVKLPYKIISVD
jgi:hypothetical protein